MNRQLSFPRAALGSIALAAPTFSQCPEWSTEFHAAGVDGGVYTFLQHDSGSGPRMYVGGDFDSVGPVKANHIAVWDGVAFSSLGDGLPGAVYAMAWFDDGNGPALYAGGNDFLAVWDGATWTDFGAQGNVRAMHVYDEGNGPALFVGGVLLNAIGGVTARGLARFDGTAWSQVGAGVSGRVRALEVYDRGQGGTPLRRRRLLRGRRRDDEQHHVLGRSELQRARHGSLDFRLLRSRRSPLLKVYDDGLVGGPSLYVGGFYFRGANRNWMRWSAAGWDPLPTSPGAVSGLTVADLGAGEQLFVSGLDSTVAFSWDGAIQTDIDLGGELDLRTVGAFDDGASSSVWFGSGYGGINATAHGQRPNRLVVWNGVQAETVIDGKGLGTGRFDGQPSVLHTHDFGSGPELVAGGKFASAGGEAAQLVAAFDGDDWRPLGDNLDGWNVLDLASFDDGSGLHLYACGNDLTTTTGSRACARFNGTSWEDFGGGIDNFSEACELVVFDEGSGERLFIGGDFTSIGSTGIDYFARWNGSTWTSVGGGLSSGSIFGGVGAAVIFDDGSGRRCT